MTTMTDHEMPHINYSHTVKIVKSCHYCKAPIVAGKFCETHAAAHRKMVLSGRCSRLDRDMLDEHDTETK